MKQFDRSASYHGYIMVEGSTYDGNYENVEISATPYSTYDVFTDWYFRIIDFNKNAFLRN